MKQDFDEVDSTAGCVRSDAYDFLADHAMTQPSNVDFDLLKNKTFDLEILCPMGVEMTTNRSHHLGGRNNGLLKKPCGETAWRRIARIKENSDRRIHAPQFPLSPSHYFLSDLIGNERLVIRRN